MSRRPSVIIVGGGFGGLSAARALKSAPVDVTLIYRVADGRVAENWHIEDNLTLQQQLGFIAK